MKDWVQKRVAELIDGLSAGVSVRSVSDATSGPAVLKTSAISKGRFDSNEAKPILPADLPRARQSVLADSMIVSRMNTPELVGEVGYSPKTHRNLYLPDRLWSARARRGSGTDMRWVTYYFASEPGARLLRGLATGTSGSMKNIPKARILNLEISTPPPAEQRAIANSLFAADQLISALERLIVKKQAMKTGMMQQLLTGRKRLPGFSDSWDVIRISQIGELVTGSTPATSNKANFGTYLPFITPAEVHGQLRTSRAVRLLSPEGAARSRVLPRGSTLITCIGTIGKTALTSEPVATNQQITAIVPKSTFDDAFVFYLLTYARERLAGAASQQVLPILNKSRLGELTINVPNKEEQKQIATVLVDLDADISRLQARLVKVRDIKQGMMQQLLTGRTRLPAEVTS